MDLKDLCKQSGVTFISWNLNLDFFLTSPSCDASWSSINLGKLKLRFYLVELKCDLTQTLGGKIFTGARADCFALRLRSKVVFILNIWENFNA